jgi:SAM-dependent methyltransferase
MTSNQLAWESFAPFYILMSNDWDRQLDDRGALIGPLLEGGKTRPLHILDIAGGPGGDAISLSKRGHRIASIDNSPAMTAQARLHLIEHGAEARLLVGDALALPFTPGNAFDAANIGGNSLAVFPRDRVASFCAGVRRILTPKGRFVIGMRDYEPVLPALPGTQTFELPFECIDRFGPRTIAQSWNWTSSNTYDATALIEWLDGRPLIRQTIRNCCAWRCEDVVALLGHSGFEVIDVHRAHSKSVYDGGLDQLLIEAEAA